MKLITQKKNYEFNDILFLDLIIQKKNYELNNYELNNFGINIYSPIIKHKKIK